MSRSTMNDHMPEPQCLVRRGRNGWELVENTVKSIKAIQQPMVVVSVIGRYRDGKSYLANCLAGETKGFALGDTVESKTKGIWVWCRPHPKRRNTTLTVLDTEGLDDLSKEGDQEDLHIFIIAALMSTFVLYNCKTVLDRKIVESLQIAIEMVRRLKVTTEKTTASNIENLKQFLPALGIVIRDFSLKLEMEGKQYTEDGYLAKCLELKSDDGDLMGEYNAPRKIIRNSFGELKCFCLPRPVEGVEDLANLENIPVGQLRTDFREKIDQMCEYIACNAVPFSFEEVEVNCGGKWIVFLSSCIEEINKGTLPVIQSTVTSTIVSWNRDVFHESQMIYSNAMENIFKKRTVPLESHELKNVIKDCMDPAMENFVKQVWIPGGEAKKLQEYLQKFENAIAEEAERFEMKNREESKKFNEKLLYQLEQELVQKCDAGSYSKRGGFKQFESDLQQVISKYNENARGPETKTVIEAYRKGKQTVTKVIMENDRSLTEGEIREAKKEKMWQDEFKKLDLARKQMDEKHNKKQMELVQMVQKHKQELRDRQLAENDRLKAMMEKNEEQLGQVTRQMDEERKKSEKRLQEVLQKHGQELHERQVTENDKLKTMMEESNEKHRQVVDDMNQRHSHELAQIKGANQQMKNAYDEQLKTDRAEVHRLQKVVEETTNRCKQHQTDNEALQNKGKQAIKDGEKIKSEGSGIIGSFITSAGTAAIGTLLAGPLGGIIGGVASLLK